MNPSDKTTSIYWLSKIISLTKQGMNSHPGSIDGAGITKPKENAIK